MKKLNHFLLPFVAFLGVALAGCSDFRFHDTRTIEAEILTINENIFSGELIGFFLSSPSGKLVSDAIKVGVKFEYGGETFLKDLDLEHAELAYYKDRKTLPLKITCDYSDIVIALNDRNIRRFYPSYETLVNIKKNLRPQ